MVGGEAMVCAIQDGRVVAHTDWAPNVLVVSAGAILAHAAFPGGALPGVNALYIEFQNVAQPGDPATIPTVDPDDLTYYQALASASNQDYLRVPLLPVAEFSVVPGHEAKLPTGITDRVLATAVTADTVGVNGKPFTAAAQSVVCGVAAVCVRDWADPTRDVLFGRVYYPQAGQLARAAAVEIAARYRWPVAT